jgi:hypothetical protein
MADEVRPRLLKPGGVLGKRPHEQLAIASEAKDGRSLMKLGLDPSEKELPAAAFDLHGRRSLRDYFADVPRADLWSAGFR